MQTNSTKAMSSEKRSALIFAAVFVVAFVAIMVVFDLLAGGSFLTKSNLVVILSHALWPTFTAWAFCFLFASGYTDMSVGGVMVLGSVASCVFGNWYGYPGVLLGGLVVGTVLIFLNFNIFAFTKIPSWIASISLALIYEAIAFALKMGEVTKSLVDTELNRDYRLLGKLPWSLILVIVGLVVVYYIYNRTTIGINVRAIGGNADVSKSLGINITKTLLGIGLICGVLIGIACFMQESYSGRVTVKTGLTSINMILQPMAIYLLAKVLEKRMNIIIAIPICSFIIYAVFNMLMKLGVPSGTLQETVLGIFIVLFGVIGQRGVKGVVK
ncbi:MAG: ABC transporter permease [Clostridia bacterium]|nr:ABC transporter permease [Clostridia bacterium]